MNRDQLLNLTLTDLSFKELVAVFKRRKAVVWGVALIFLAFGILVSAVMPATYRAASLIIVEGKTQANPNNQASNAVEAITQTSSNYDVMTQIQIMQSFDVFYKALRQINYDLPAKLTQSEYDKLPKVTVQQVQTTNSVQVAVEGTKDSDVSALAAAVPQVYKQMVLDDQKSNVERSLTFISARIDEEKKGQQGLQTELAQYKAEQGVSDSKSETDSRVGKVAEMQRKLAEADGDVAAAAAAIEQAKVNRDSAPKTIELPSVVTKVETINRAHEVLEGLIAQRDVLLVSNYPDSERVQRADAQIAAQRKTIQELESNPKISAASSIRNPNLDDLDRQVNFAISSHKASIAKRDQLKLALDEARNDIKSLAPIFAKQQEYETRLLESEQTIQYLQKLEQDIKVRDNALMSPIRDVTGTPMPIFIRPIWPLNLALALAAGLFFGCILALVRDVSLDRVNTSTEASAIADKDILGRIPIRASARDPLIADPQKALAFEAYRILRSSILLAAPETSAFVVTSSVPREGKSTIAANLAVAMALEGKRTVLVDGNLRNPAVHKLFKVAKEKGLSDVLSGALPLADGLKTVDIPNLALLTAGGEAANPTELVASDAMGDVIEKLKGQADIVIIDAPAAFGFADSQSLVKAVKDVLFVTQLEAPNKQQMRESVGMIDFAGGKILGLILNKDKLAARRVRGAA
ncbi:MAG: polysaccharide biosynthesis tyrosine autokinase [Armatimonadetes bacterium]|nr:polysaccharide biosynthesis tyrosine autokinase [Armatimonadota bacterium]